MKAFSLAIIFSLCISFNVYGKGADHCLENANTQSEMDRCAGIDFQKADRELNRVYKRILKAYKNNKEFLSKLKKSELAWLKLRDADMEMRFPLKDKQSQYGSVYPMCYSEIETTLTLQRIAYLKQWLAGIEEGDVCSGSIKRPDEIRDALKSKKGPEKN